ncbi:F-box DNA helicase 1 isoform X1 [Cygnus olor]|uniref:F-box DNA helicase 1 isoform X1 n=2 Tax=Cygnus olor TaxID=8869 RepID=UPI001ADE31F6|nr:F-box DNA helicase 1 isoform X1 [Cygnus olor]
MKRFKKIHFMAGDCRALARSAEGLSSLTQPLSQKHSSRDLSRGLQPSQQGRRHRKAQGQQKSITDYFKISQTQQVRGEKNVRVKEELLDPVFIEADESFSSVSALLEASGGSSSFLEDEDFVPAPRKSSRKRPRSSAAAGRPKRDHDLWGEPEQKPVVRPKRAQTKHELDDVEVEPIPDAHYGLLGTRSWEVPQGSIADLPAEVLRNVFAFLPVTDLFQSVSLVCHCWRDVVSDPLFIPWKKLYHRYLMKEDVALCTVEQILQDFAITKQHEGAVLGLIRYVSAIPTNRKVDPGVVLPLLRSHHLFSKAEVCIANTLPHLQSRTGPENVWAVITAMVLFSDGVRDIQKLIACLQRPSSALSVVDVTETLYCIATLLYAMREKSIAITNRIHYNVFYCLYLMENASVTMPQMIQEETQSSQCRQDFWSSCLSEVKLTHEQQRILNHKIERGQVVKIMAFAGTGKTSTLAKYAEKFADLKFLYVSFSKAVVERGKSVFPRNVTCRTFHSLAFGSVGKYYKEKGKLNVSKLTAYTMSFLIRNRAGQSQVIRGKTVLQTLENFFSSSDEEICEEHTPIWFINTHGEKKLVSQEEKKINVEEAKEIWHNMKDLNGDVEKKYKITCDGYLKLWQLSKPQLSGYDAVFVDEAQDCTPAIVDIVLSQTCGIILVGDPHQQIYSFRGAVNTLYTVPHTHIYYLTQSFRFGPEIAYVGATILDVCKSVRNKTLVGGNQEGDVRGSMKGKITILSRSNFNVFEDAVRLTGRQGQIKIRVIGGLACFGLSRIYDIWKLSQPADERKEANLVINDPFIRRWEETDGFIGLRDYATRIDDKELQVKIAIVEKYKERMPELVRKIESSHVSREALADYIIGTVHQAKGLEFDTVLVADDFVSMLSAVRHDRIPNSLIGMYPEDEWNLLYVAVTRAKKCLLMSKTLKIILALAGEHFLRVELLSKAVKDGAKVTCSVPQCAQSLQSRLVVKKLPVTYSNGSTDADGYLCYSCAQKCFGTMTSLAFFPALQE